MLLYVFVNCVLRLYQVVSTSARLYHMVKLVSNSPVLLKIFNLYAIICCYYFGSLAAIERLAKSSIALKITNDGSVRLH